MNLLNMLEENAGKSNTQVKKETVSVLIGKAWPKTDGGFSISPLSEPVEGKPGQFQISAIYPLIVTDFCSIRFGLNKKCDAAKNQNTHWAFLNIEKDRLDDYKEMLSKIGQEIDTK